MPVKCVSADKWVFEGWLEDERETSQLDKNWYRKYAEKAILQRNKQSGEKLWQEGPQWEKSGEQSHRAQGGIEGKSRGIVEMRRKRRRAVCSWDRKTIFFDSCINENLQGVRKPISVQLTCCLGRRRNCCLQRVSPPEPPGGSTCASTLQISPEATG